MGAIFVAEDSVLLRRIAPCLRWRYPMLVIFAFASSLQHMRGTGEDWDFFVLGSELLFGTHHGHSTLPGGLHLYANYPDIQIGPLSFLVATPFRLLGDPGRVVAALVMTAVAPALVLVLERSARLVRSRTGSSHSETLLALTAFLGGIAVVQSWSTLATIYGHLDDVLVLVAGVAAISAVTHHRPLLLGTVIGLGMAAKPWGIVFLPLVLALSGHARWKALGTASAITAVAWLPFVLADAGTLEAIRPAVVTSPASVLYLLGVPATDAPGWVRPVQLGAALVAGVLAVLRRRWGAVLLVGIAVRVALDPQVFLYYSAGLLVAALAWDLLRSPNPLPLWTFGAFVFLNVAYVLGASPESRAVMRLLVTAGVVGTTLLAPARPQANQRLSVRPS